MANAMLEQIGRKAKDAETILRSLETCLLYTSRESMCIPMPISMCGRSTSTVSYTHLYPTEYLPAFAGQ